MKMEASIQLINYFDHLEKEIAKVYSIASKARLMGYDPEKKVDIPLAKGIAQRVEGLVSALAPQIMKSGIAERIVELEKIYGSLDWRVSLKIAEEVSSQKFCKFESKIKAMETGVRVGLAYITLGVISAPLEGFIELKIKERKDGKKYLAAFYAGPIRAAGGTAEAVSLVIIDYIRICTGYEKYDATEKEIKRLITEIRDYHDRVTNLQYTPSDEELEFLLRNIPIEINGDPTEEMEVSNYKDLPRIETNRIRGGVCLVLAEGIAQKAPKLHKQIKKWGHNFGLEWEFLEEFLNIQKTSKAKGIGDKKEVTPNYTYISDLVAGRPVLSFPMTYGGFRLRYGRARTTGLAAAAIHPQSMNVLNNYIAVGTQLKLERPGKAASIAVCDSIDGPIVKFKDGSVDKLSNTTKVDTDNIEKILFLGDILFNYGDFSENGHKLIPIGYCEEWWIKEFEKAVLTLFGSVNFSKIKEILQVEEKDLRNLFKNPQATNISSRLAHRISRLFKIPLHPQYTYYWTNLTKQELLLLYEWISKSKFKSENGIVNKIIAQISEPKRYLEKIGVPHLLVSNEFVVLQKEHAHNIYEIFMQKKNLSKTINESKSVLEAISKSLGIIVRDKAGTFIGARMGRPEKAKMRRLSGSPHFLFPVGEEGGRLRSIQSTLEKGKITAEFPIRICTNCRKETIFQICEDCEMETKSAFYCPKCGIIDEICTHNFVFNFRKKNIDINRLLKAVLKKSNIKIFPDLIKGVKGTSNKNHIPEHLIKGILRSKHNVYVNKDGTTRYDMIELPLTHFKANEIGTSLKRLIELGYSIDIHGKSLTNEEQVIELKPQDLILAASPDSPDEPADVSLLKVTKFIDELLKVMYKLPAFYNLESKKELVGHLIVGLAPHTSAGIVGRIIGFSRTQGMLAHPLYHAAMRRNCDGDEACVILLMDALLNFSRSYLPDRRGSRTMDAPLVLTSLLDPSEVDDEVHGIDMVWEYPLELYNAAMNYKDPWDVKIRQLDHVLHTEKQYENYGYTHEVSDINSGVLCSAYKILPTMQEKLMGQMELAEKITAVQANEVAALVIEKHFLKDIKGNLRKFSMQQFRCVACNMKYRRPPLIGKCISCDGKIILTISKGSVVKYLEPSISLARKYKVSPYLIQSLELLQRQIESILGKEKERQEGLGKWFG